MEHRDRARHPNRRAVPLHTLCCSSSLSYARLDAWRKAVILFVLLCCWVFLNTYFRQTNKLITPTSCHDVSNHIRGAVFPNRCCQDSAESPAALAKACSDARADKESLYPCCCCATAPAAKPHPPARMGPLEHPSSGHLQSPSLGVEQRLCKSNLSALGGYLVLHGARAMWT